MHLTTLILPGLDGTGLLSKNFASALPPELKPTIVAYPPTQSLGYDELEPLVEALIPSGEPFLLVAESFSGPLALRVAAKAPPGLRGVVLVATFVRNPAWWFPSWLRDVVSPWIFRRTPPEFLLQRYLTGSDAPPEFLAALRAAIGQVAPAVLARRVGEILAVDARDALRACAVPLLYLAGTHDRLVPPTTARSLQQIRPELQVERLDAPHLVLQRQPEEAARLVAAFAAAGVQASACADDGSRADCIPPSSCA